jgi:DNA modification methylase
MLSRAEKSMVLSYRTKLGKAYCGDSLEFLHRLKDASVNLVFTSPPYALHFKKEYGNADQKDYVEWFLPFARHIYRILPEDGSFVLNIGGAWTPGKPERSLYIYRLVLRLCDEIGFKLAQELFWYNPAKMPAPAEWVNVRRIRVKDSVEYLFWFSKSSFPKASNSNVLQEYSRDMQRLIIRGVKKTTRPSGHNIKSSFSEDKGGSIPSNLIESGNNESNSAYIKECKRLGLKVHPARFPSILPEFFINLLTDKGDLVYDPFSGSNTTGMIAERLGRRWLSSEISEEYVEASKIRFSLHEEQLRTDKQIGLFEAANS